MSPLDKVADILRADLLRWELLAVVRDLDLADCWIGAGFVRNAVWDYLHGYPSSILASDVDVIWFDPLAPDEEADRACESELRTRFPQVRWSVKNQARMHLRNGDRPYRSATDAMRYWPETATAVAARRTSQDDCQIAGPFGADDLVNLVLRPGQHFTTAKRHVYQERVRHKQWRTRWPLLREMADDASHN